MQRTIRNAAIAAACVKGWRVVTHADSYCVKCVLMQADGAYYADLYTKLRSPDRLRIVVVTYLVPSLDY